ncbi:hypothetical protein FRX31_017091 [Thalictrum thalictroides]|uniref:Uncharacterized protein n=1 Tax=Thalictrum thalictroides TaxID=46969 RepID=A0A7J6WAU9_THATH|nr:hypothetical protein FRX31_017091 [Thalictrum thalictroides]
MAKQYMIYEERILNFILRDVMNRVDITLAAAMTPTMREEELEQAMNAEKIMNTWTTPLLKILEVVLHLLKYNGKVRRSILRMMERKSFIEGGFEGNAIVEKGEVHRDDSYCEGEQVLWSRTKGRRRFKNQSNHAIHAVATMKNGGDPWILSSVYADPHKEKRKSLWKEFDGLSQIEGVG